MAGRVVKPPSQRGILHHSTPKLLERSDISKHEPLLRKLISALFGKTRIPTGSLVEYDDKLNRYRMEFHDLKQPMP